MTFPVVQARASGSQDVDSTSHPITLPAGIVPNELLLVVFSCDGVPTHSAPPGWMQVGTTRVYSTNVSASVWYRYARGSDSLTLTTSAAEQSSHISFRISGVASLGGASVQGFSTNTNPPSYTLPGGIDDVLWIATRCGDGTVVATSAPSSFANLQTKAAGTANGASTNTAERNLRIATLDPAAFTSTNAIWASWTIGVVGGTPPPLPSGMSVWTGSAWVDKPAKVWTGSAWKDTAALRWNGSAWI